MKKACFFLASTDKGINVETQLETIAEFLISKKHWSCIWGWKAWPNGQDLPNILKK